MLFVRSAGRQARLRRRYRPDTLTEVLGKEPDRDALPRDTPSGLRRLLFRALRKDARVRLQHVGDARIELLDTSDEPSAQAPASSKPRYAVMLAVALTAALLNGLAVWRLVGFSATNDSPVVRMTLSPPESEQLVAGELTQGHRPPVAISRDGQKLHRESIYVSSILSRLAY